MTIREALQRRTRGILLLGFVSWVAFALSLFAAVPLGVPMLPVVFFVPFLAAAVAQTFLVRCPRCNGNVGLLVAQTLVPGRFRRHLTTCPFCGVSLDDHA